MKIFFLKGLISVLMIAGTAWAQEDAKPLTLEECYALSLKRSEQIEILMQKIEEVEGQYIQAISTVTPKANFLLKEFHQDSPSNDPGEGGGQVGKSFNLESQPERKFKLSQPVFQGFRSLAAIGGANALKKQRMDEVQRGKELLFLDVVNAFYGILRPRDEIESLQHIRDLSQQRITELEDRVRLGRSRPSEVSNAVAQLKSVQAEIEDTRRSEVAFVNVLRFLTGLNDITDLVDSPELPSPPGDLDFYLAKAENRSDVSAARQAVIVSKQSVIIARSDLFPKLSVDSNLYTKRVGFQAPIDWDVTLTFDVPIFDVVKVSGLVREAMAKLHEAELEYSRVLRTAQREIREAYEELKLSLASAEAFHQAEIAANENFSIQTKEYRLNLVNNLDVLAALQSLESARRDLLKARYQTKQDMNRLKVVTGDIK